MSRYSRFHCFGQTLALLAAMASSAEAATPADILAAAPRADWQPLDPSRLLVMQLANGRRVTILLAADFAPRHVANIRALAAAHWYDGLWISRVQDNYVAQWGDPDGKKSLPPVLGGALPAEYERPLAGLAFRPLPYRDTFAPQVGFADGWPVASDGQAAWLAHCYGMVGVGRDNEPDTGNGAELYAIIGHAPRALDRNIALVGRVVEGIDALAALPRGTKELGFYATVPERTVMTRVALASELPAADRPRLEMLRSHSASFAEWVKVRANRQDAFYVRPAGAIDLCSVLPPVRVQPR